jgi:hypothetical protein
MRPAGMLLLYHFDHKFSHASQPEKKPLFKITRTQKKIYQPSWPANFQNSRTYGRNGTVHLGYLKCVTRCHRRWVKHGVDMGAAWWDQDRWGVGRKGVIFDCLTFH